MVKCVYKIRWSDKCVVAGESSRCVGCDGGVSVHKEKESGAAGEGVTTAAGVEDACLLMARGT